MAPPSDWSSTDLRINLPTPKPDQSPSTSGLASPSYNTLDMKIDGMQAELKDTFGIECSQSRLYRARRRANEILEGDHGKSYEKITTYAEMVRRTNPGSMVKIQLDRVTINHQPTFKRLFFCLDAMKQRFLAGCRPFIGMDGCFPKGPFGGMLLTAIGLDGDLGIYPIAFAVVESETKDSWNFFIHCLHSVLGDVRDLTLMTDRQKGVLPAIEEILPKANNRYCARHIYNNFRANHPGSELKTHFWRASRATSIHAFKYEMDHIKKHDSKAFEYLAKIDPSAWSAHAFDKSVKSDHVTNNITESFNGWLGVQRSKAIMTMIEFLRRKLMTRMQKRYEKGLTWGGRATLRVKRKLKEIGDKSRFCNVVFVGGPDYEVLDDNVGYVGNIEKRECICGAWQITGIPCKHAMAALRYKRLEPEEFVDAYFTKEVYLKTYSHLIHPIPDESMWPALDLESINPPSLHRRPGRPKKNRRREADESAPGSSRRSGLVRCQRCKQYGHNKRTCQGAPAGSGGRAGRSRNGRGSGRSGNGRSGAGRSVGRRRETNEGTQSSVHNTQGSQSSMFVEFSL
ncbi:hypothetical protein HHK36_017389 [Tetracentron sinense]|uniref:SWIM-type domain-containing protein n=1 Tax=Tetracentron sinense TaxID=13715 RepID=A0A835DCT1_TETSI|nr:hypothetical protein HHK36_017389 [Tetracentron sinense]